MNKSDIKLEDLVETTARIMLRYNINDLSTEKLSRNTSNIWHVIASKYFKSSEYKDAVNIHSWWKRNQNGFKNAVLNKISRNKINLSKSITLTITFEDWSKILEYISKTDRRRFKSEFDIFLSEKLQASGINCWLTCNNNWFRNSRNFNSVFWSGRYDCIDKNCLNKFEAFISDDIEKNFKSRSLFDVLKKDFFNLNVSYVEKTIHDKKIFPLPRCSGKKRTEQAKTLAFLGISNCVDDNIIHNAFNTSSGKKCYMLNELISFPKTFLP
jgi:hypothetical protein